MTVLKKIGLLILLSLLVSACDSANGPEYRADANPARLMGKKWQWVGYTSLNGGYFSDVPAGSYFTISRDTIWGVDGCNPFSGTCTLRPSELSADSLAFQTADCSARSFVCLLESPAEYRQRDSMLVIVPASGPMVHLVFKQQ
jgi:heat shock protein HslJ